MERWTALLPDRAVAAAAGPAAPKPKLIGRLSEDAWVAVCHFLPIPDLPQLALCNRKLARLVADDRVWRTKLAWLDYRGPDEVDWRTGPQKEPRTSLEKAPASARTSLDPQQKQRSTAPAVAAADDDDFGDFFEGEAEPVAPARTGRVTADDGFGDFQDGDADPDPFGLAEDFGEVALEGVPAVAGKPKPPADDLLLMFDDDALPSASAPPQRPGTLSRLTFETPPPAITSPTTSRPGAFAFNPANPTPTSATFTSSSQPEPLISVFKTYQTLLLPYYASLKTHTTSSLVFTNPSLAPMQRARLLASLARFCHPLVAPTRSLPQRLAILRNVQSAMDFFESTLLAEFERADAAADEDAMRDRASVMWEVNQSQTVAQVFVQKRETMFGAGHSPLRNLTKIETPSGAEADGIDFSAMDHFMQSILQVLNREGSLIARVFPPASDVLLYFLERIANDVVSDYITTLLSAAQPLQNPLFLLATAATFGQVYRLVDAVLAIEPRNELVTKERAEDIVFRVFEPLMDDYLSEEGEWIREVLEGICEEWDRKTASALALSDPTFLASQNPAQVKKNVLAGFTKVLLLPVTIIPKTAMYGVNAITYGGTAVIDTFAQLGTQLAGAGAKTPASAAPTPPSEEPVAAAPAATAAVVAGELESSAAAWGGDGNAVGGPRRLSVDAIGVISLDGALSSPTGASAPAAPRRAGRFDRLQLLLSLDTALQLLQADRDSLKRIQTFLRFPGAYGRKVRDAIEEVFIVLLQVLGEKHVGPAFEKARRQMETYKPEEHDDDGGSVAPLVQFFELVHIGDTIQQMVDVYFEKEMAAYIDRRDFLNVVVREKKRFEASLDDAVAQGLNAAVNILMTQVEHLVTTRQGLRDYTPDEGDDFDLTPTRACNDAVAVLRQHCDMLKGSTDKHILEVFNQEVGIRLFGILLKHLKRQIVSTAGGLQLIADLNAYHAFVTSLRQPAVTSYFTSLKMVGEIYLVDDPKGLGALVRDTSRYEGVLSPEDLYELVQRRSDWKRIERDVDKALFGFKVADDCVVS
ncbi:F-box protein: endocytic membrane traffic, recycling ReCYcling 1 [Rhodotorula kratochvilovae]